MTWLPVLETRRCGEVPATTRVQAHQFLRRSSWIKDKAHFAALGLPMPDLSLYVRIISDIACWLVLRIMDMLEQRVQCKAIKVSNGFRVQKRIYGDQKHHAHTVGCQCGGLATRFRSRIGGSMLAIVRKMPAPGAGSLPRRYDPSGCRCRESALRFRWRHTATWSGPPTATPKLDCLMCSRSRQPGSSCEKPAHADTLESSRLTWQRNRSNIAMQLNRISWSACRMANCSPVAAEYRRSRAVETDEAVGCDVSQSWDAAEIRHFH